MKTYLLAFLLLTSQSSFSQINLDNTFQRISYRFKNKLMTDFARSLLFKYATEQYKSYDEAVKELGQLQNNKRLQDCIMLNLLKNFRKGQFLRAQLAEMCGSYTEGNKLAEYIERKYGSDKRYLEHLRKAKERSEAETDSIPPEDALPPDGLLNPVNLQLQQFTMRDTDINTHCIRTNGLLKHTCEDGNLLLFFLHAHRRQNVYDIDWDAPLPYSEEQLKLMDGQA